MNPFEDSKSRIKLFLIVAVVSAVLAVGGILLLTGMRVSPSAALPVGQEITVTGIIVKHNTGCYVDGICSYTINSEQGRMEVVSAIGWTCLNDPFLEGDSVGIGSIVEVFGMVESVDTISTCSSPEYYIKSAGFKPRQVQSGIVFETEAEALCGPQPPAICQPSRQLGCNVKEKRWDCFPLDTQANDASAWQTYRNEKFGFEVKYPEGWEVNEFFDELQSSGRGFVYISNLHLASTFAIYGYLNEEQIPLENWHLFKNSVEGKKVYTVNVSGIDASKVDVNSTRLLESQIFFEREGQIFHIITRGDKESIPFFDQILSTFRFVK